MSLFVRRHLQHCINEVSGCIPREKLQRLVRQLNGGGAEPLGFEWELVLLWAFSRNFHVEYEPGEPNAAKVDLVVYERARSSACFAAEIKSISDLSRHEQNDVERLFTVLARAKVEVGLNARVRYMIGGETHGEYRNARMTLRLPQTDEDWLLVETRVCEYLHKSKRGQQQPLHLLDKGIDITISTEAGSGFSGGYPAYTATYSLYNNPVVSALSDKARSINRVRPRPCDAVGVILCDRGCQLLSERTAGSASVPLRDVVTNFLESEQNKTIDFVLTLGIVSNYRSVSRQEESHVVTPQFFCKQSRLSEVRRAFQMMKLSTRLLPPAQSSADNAVSAYLDGNGRLPRNLKPMTRTGRTSIRVSTQWLMDILAERITVAEAMERYRGRRPTLANAFENPFQRMRSEGRMPCAAKVIRDPATDDDEIEIEFGDKDAAAGPFVMPP
jgi:hypothetical protein